MSKVRRLNYDLSGELFECLIFDGNGPLPNIYYYFTVFYMGDQYLTGVSKFGQRFIAYHVTVLATYLIVLLFSNWKTSCSYGDLVFDRKKFG